jgi:hypothetical protein
LGEEIAQAITSAPIGEPIDESELDDELAELEQEQLDNQMLKTGNVPVTDEVHKLPAAANGESKFGKYFYLCDQMLTALQSKAKRPLPWRMTRRKNFESCKPRWLCDVGTRVAVTFPNIMGPHRQRRELAFTTGFWLLWACRNFVMRGMLT